uniref:Carboxylic ester hydrolase (EC) n=1 Tax=Ganoderma boninense TaxID=34458 RepID=A0A5K1JWH9_9APHY|nr:Carboxylic ester hydrolase (EC [Ganoderma boninense]
MPDGSPSRSLLLFQLPSKYFILAFFYFTSHLARAKLETNGSVRATNVYEEQSLGVYEDTSKEDDELNDDARWNSSSESRVAIWGKYLARHARRQLSFDMWWLALSLLLLCIIERDNLMNPTKVPYFNVFALRLVFEVVSAYGTVGLSLGIPGLNYSLSGGMHTLSKLVISVVMLRGRHRGLPVALDRAVLMPSEFLATRSRNPSPPSPPGEQKGEPEKIDEPDSDPGPPPVVQQDIDKDELAERLRLRTRTVSLQVPIPGDGHAGGVPEPQDEVSATSSLAEDLSEDDGGSATPSSESRAETTSEGSTRT